MTTLHEGGGGSSTTTSTTATATAAHTAAHTTATTTPPRMVDSRFYCNICLDPVVDPVATMCGHLYCWPCLYRWLEPGMTPVERANLLLGAAATATATTTTGVANPPAGDSHRRVCPVCKAPCSVPSLVPIYVRESDAEHEEADTRRPESEENHSCDPRTLTEGTDNSNREGTAAIEESSHEAPSHGSTRRRENDTEDDQDEDAAGGLSRDSGTGVRQRARFRSHDSYTSVDSTASTVPSRPLAPSPRELSPTTTTATALAHMTTPPRFTTNNNSTSWATQLTPTAHRPGSLAHGFLMSIQQATTGHSGIPPLHHHHRRWDGSAAGGEDGTHPYHDLDVAHSGATEYLSRLLFMFSSFVILCLLIM